MFAPLLAVLAFQLAISLVGWRIIFRGLVRDYESLLKDYSDLADRYYASVKSRSESLAEIQEIKDNAELAQHVLQRQIDDMARDIQRHETLRDTLIDNIDSLANDVHRANRQIITLERSLRVARHKEWKRWKKQARRAAEKDVRELQPNELLSSEFGLAIHFRSMIKIGAGARYESWHRMYMESLHQTIARIRTMDPYPLP